MYLQELELELELVPGIGRRSWEGLGGWNDGETPDGFSPRKDMPGAEKDPDGGLGVLLGSLDHWLLSPSSEARRLWSRSLSLLIVSPILSRNGAMMLNRVFVCGPLVSSLEFAAR